MRYYRNDILRIKGPKSPWSEWNNRIVRVCGKGTGEKCLKVAHLESALVLENIHIDHVVLISRPWQNLFKKLLPCHS